MANPSQRIYIGGIDPDRGLTVEVVSSRLQSVKGVEIVAINDVPVKDVGDGTCAPKGQIYNPKHRVIDEDGDLVDTRKFFYIEARTTSEASTSALDLLAKQYNNTKWKGCSLRVEEAKPHFLKRLEQEREERKEREAAVASALSTEIEEARAIEEDGNVDEQEADVEVKKNRRRLRIRQRFGAEAFLVDTHPRQLQLGNGSADGWKEFASLRERMINKRESQRKNLVERRKQERRSWAGGNGNKESNLSESGDLRSLIFLNRGIHIRFDSIEPAELELVSDDNSDHSRGDTEDITEDDESSSSSESSDSSSLSEDGGNKNAYTWSDDEEDDDVSMANDHEDNDVSSESGEDEVRVKNEKEDTDDESIEKQLTRPTRSNNLKAGTEYTKAVVADEFAFGADFDFDPSDVDSDSADSGNLAVHESMEIDLEGDISSNINILSRIFPGDHFDCKPLADANDGSDNNGVEDVKEKQKFGAGLIMQRYDPTKDTATRPVKVETKITQPENEIEEDNRSKEQSAESSASEDVSVSSESSESINTEEGKEVKKDEEKLEEETSVKATESLSTNAAVNESKEDVYEQDELENVFKQSRQQADTNSTGGFSFGFQVPGEAAKEPTNQNSSFVFGFNVSDEPKVKKDLATTDVPVTSEETKVAVEEKKEPSAYRVRRIGLRFPECDLNAYEDLFFSLNEGPRILKDLDAMKQDEENQTLWQKEREQLTADWKRKHKAAQSRRVKQRR